MSEELIKYGFKTTKKHVEQIAAAAKKNNQTASDFMRQSIQKAIKNEDANEKLMEMVRSELELQQQKSIQASIVLHDELLKIIKEQSETITHLLNAAKVNEQNVKVLSSNLTIMRDTNQEHFETLFETIQNLGGN